jgi:hypothetical protein
MSLTRKMSSLLGWMALGLLGLPSRRVQQRWASFHSTSLPALPLLASPAERPALLAHLSPAWLQVDEPVPEGELLLAVENKTPKQDCFVFQRITGGLNR